MRSQSEKATAFRVLHTRDHAFVIPNPWDIGSAKLLEKAGFEALATTSAGFARSIGKEDHEVTRDEKLVHAAALCSAVDLPISADLENGFGDDLAFVAETIKLAAEAGLVGGSIEDYSAKRGERYDIEFAADRIRAAVSATQGLGFDFTLTARAENFITGHPDLADTIKRLQAYQEAGAHVLFAPGIKTKDEIAAVVSSVDRPVNVLVGMPGMSLSVADLNELGVKRISVGSALHWVAMQSVLKVATEIREKGTFSF
jgi:2-methylisocitrate lyase-like PEP mutase family enzyme